MPPPALIILNSHRYTCNIQNWSRETQQVALQGQAARRGVQTGWRLTEIKLGANHGNGGSADFHVTPNSTPREILDAIAAIRKRGKTYNLCFSL